MTKATQPEESWDSEEELKPLNITAPEDWGEYNAFLESGGGLEYDDWRSVMRGLQQAAEGKARSLGSFADHAEDELVEEDRPHWSDGLEEELAKIFYEDLEFFQKDDALGGLCPWFRGSAIADVIVAIKKIREGIKVEPGSFG